ncbi:MAG: pyridoxal phosphate-dependent aminotransferase [Chitinivibrionales bacterium]|nr:pyridoxal phosphate-dependent aminotransferase [Chitinivibrionales bacterium]
MIFSDRFTTYQQTPNPLSMLMHNQKKAGVEIVDLTISNPTHAQFDYDEKSIVKALTDNQAAVRYEPTPNGQASARQAIADYYWRRSNWRVEWRDLLLTASTSEAYSYIFKLIANPGDEILIPQPSYPLFEFLIQLEALQYYTYPLVFSQGGWKIDFPKLINCISTKTKAIILVNPNNPTGSYVKRHEWEKLLALCRDYSLSLIIDEVFFDYRATATTIANQYPCFGKAENLTFILNGFSKILALPNLKLGWIMMNGPVEIVEQARQRLELIADTYLSVSMPVQYGTEALFRTQAAIQGQIQNRLDENERFLIESFRDSALCTPLPREGGWYAVCETFGSMTDEAFALILLGDYQLYVHPGYFYNFHDRHYVVISLLTPKSQFRRGIQKLLSALQEHASRHLIQ